MAQCFQVGRLGPGGLSLQPTPRVPPCKTGGTPALRECGALPVYVVPPESRGCENTRPQSLNSLPLQAKISLLFQHNGGKNLNHRVHRFLEPKGFRRAVYGQIASGWRGQQSYSNSHFQA